MKDDKSEKQTEQPAVTVVVGDGSDKSVDQAPEQSQAAAAGSSSSDGDSISWSASEYVHYHKDITWFLGLAVILVILSAGSYFYLHSIFSTAIIIISGITFGVFANRKPRELNYQISEVGLQIEQRFYRYEEFKSFSLVDEGGVASIVLVPFKRLMPPISVYFDPKDEDGIISVLTQYLPHDDEFKDPYQNMMRKIRF